METQQKEMQLTELQQNFQIVQDLIDEEESQAKPDMNMQQTIQENDSMENTPSDQKENVPFIKEITQNNKMNKIHPLSNKSPLTQQKEQNTKYEQKKKEIQEELEKISTYLCGYGWKCIEETKSKEGLDLVNKLLKMQSDRKEGNYTQEDSLVQNQFEQDNYSLQKLLENNINITEIDADLPSIDDLKKIKNIQLVVQDNFFETCGPIDQWKQVRDHTGKVIKYADCQKYGNILRLFVSSIYCSPVNEKQITFVQMYLINFSDKLIEQKLQKTGNFIFQSQFLMNNYPGFVLDMNIKLQNENIHFIRYFDSQNKIYKYIEDTEYGSIQLVNDLLNDEKNIKIAFQFDFSDQYQETYQYLIGYSLEQQEQILYKYSNNKLQEIIRKLNFHQVHHSFYEIISDSEVNFYFINRQSWNEIELISLKYQNGQEQNFNTQRFQKLNFNHNFLSYQSQQFIKNHIHKKQYKTFYQFFQPIIFSCNTEIINDAYENETRKIEQFQQNVRSKLTILQDQYFFLIDNKKIIMMNQDKIKFVYFLEDHQMAVREKTQINKELFNNFLKYNLFVNKDKQKVFSSSLNKIYIDDVFFGFYYNYVPIYLDQQFILIQITNLIGLFLHFLHIYQNQITFVFKQNKNDVIYYQIYQTSIQKVIECSFNDKILIESDQDLINFKDLIPELDSDVMFTKVTDFKYQEDQNINFLVRKKIKQNLIETYFCRLNLNNLTKDGLFMIKINNCFPLEKENLEYQLSSVSQDGKRKYQIMITQDYDGSFQNYEQIKQIQIFELQVYQNKILPIQTILINTDENLLLVYDLSFKTIVPEYDEIGQQIGTKLNFYHKKKSICYEIPLNQSKMCKINKKLITTSYYQYIHNQEITFYVLSAKFINDNINSFGQREMMDILNQGLKSVLTMKLTSFEDLDYDYIFDSHEIISQDKLQPLLFKKATSLIGEQLLSQEDLVIDSSSLQPLKTQFIPRQSIISKFYFKNDIAKYFQINNLFDLCADLDQNQLIALCIKKENFILANEFVQLLLENDENYKIKNNILMKVLPHLLENQQIEIKNYIHRNENDGKIRKVSLEQIIQNNNLPKKGQKTCKYFQISQQIQSQLNLEVIYLLKSQKFDSKETEDIEFSFLNFQNTTLQMKIDEINCVQTFVQKFVFLNKEISEINANELFIARLLNQRTDKEFFENKIIQKIIGRQSELFTLKGTQQDALIYSFGFIITYTLDILIRNQFIDDFTEQYTAWIVLNVCRAFAVLTQIYFFYLEILEIRWGIKEYFTNFVNLVDFGQFFVYVSHVIMSTMIINDENLRSDTLIIVNSYFEVFMTILSLMKLLQLLASFQELQILVILINKVIWKLIPFFIVYFVFLIEFSVMLLVAQGQYQLPKKDNLEISADYPTFPAFVATLMQTFRFSVGAQLSVEPRNQYEDSPLKYGFQSALVWIVFTIIQLILQIVILNFLIAEINDLFEKIKSGVPQFYMMLAEQNMTFLLREPRPYNQIQIIQAPVTYLPNNVDEDDFITISSKIQKYTQQQTQDIFAKIKESTEKADLKIEKIERQMTEMKQNIAKILELLSK